MMIDAICDSAKCTGCHACASACPKQCISMVKDEEGFLRPLINKSECIKCDKCKRICPINSQNIDNEMPEAFAVRNIADEIRTLSSSGGMFSALAHSILNRNGAVIAAGFDDGFQVVHKVCTKETSLNDLRKSKYVQSKIGSTFVEAKKLLDEGVKVLFCGTPCQVSGIKAYLEKDYPNLYTIDFICHGVPSPLAWEKYKEYREQQADAKLKNVSFRDKNTGWQVYSMTMDFMNGQRYSAKVTEDPYLHCFVMGMDLRPSCYECKFKAIYRQSDITLADFWSKKYLEKSWDDDKGVSLSLINSPKGKELFSSVSEQIEFRTVQLIDAIESNPAFNKSCHKPELRQSFMRELQQLDFIRLHEKYCGNGITSKIRRKIAKIIK